MAASVYTMLNCDSPTDEQAKMFKAGYVNNLLGQYAKFERESCGQSADNVAEVDGSRIMAGTIKECMLACWEKEGSEKCHGFTYDGVQSTCKFHVDIMDGKVKKDKNLSCYYKSLGYTSARRAMQ